jgi:hypothetical protein
VKYRGLGDRLTTVLGFPHVLQIIFKLQNSFYFPARPPVIVREQDSNSLYDRYANVFVITWLS